MRRSLLILIAGATLFTGMWFAGCSGECESDYDCPNEQICVAETGECEDFQCREDDDCESGETCEENRCVRP